MNYKENVLTYEDYFRLRESVGWMNFSKEQAQRALSNSAYMVTAVDSDKTVGMGRLVGDGIYYIIADIVVCPDYQKRGIGTKITDMLIEYVSQETPVGGRSSIQLIAEKGVEDFYKKAGFKVIPHEHCGFGMRKIINKSAMF